jgi:hypothetical protein
MVSRCLASQIFQFVVVHQSYISYIPVRLKSDSESLRVGITCMRIDDRFIIDTYTDGHRSTHHSLVLPTMNSTARSEDSCHSNAIFPKRWNVSDHLRQLELWTWPFTQHFIVQYPWLTVLFFVHVGQCLDVNVGSSSLPAPSTTPIGCPLTRIASKIPPSHRTEARDGLKCP